MHGYTKRLQERLTSVRGRMAIGRKIDMQHASQANQGKGEKISDILTATKNSASHVVEHNGARRPACSRPPSGSQEDIGKPDQSGPP